MITAALLCLAFRTAEAIITRHDVPQEKYYALATTVPRPVVLHLNDQGSADGMGTWIGEDWILTAAHVGEMTHVGDRVGRNAEYEVLNVVLHPGWPGDFVDIALIRVATGESENSPVPVCKPADRTNSGIIVAGAGDAGDGQSGPAVFDGKMRAAENTIHTMDETFVVFVFDSPTSPAAMPLEGISGPGDSGGPAYARTESGYCVLAVSVGQDTDPTGGVEGVYGVLEFYARVDVLREWIASVIE